jgi:ABC-type Mn2+/Zn2+ transport system permease subunit/Mn-dependent DtxR family transcriptional regulator
MGAQVWPWAIDLGRNAAARWQGAALVDTALTMAMGILVAVACAWVGCFLILQGLALLGDAISHTVLLGIVLAALVTGQAAGGAMFLAAAITGVVTALLIEGLHRATRIKEDAAMGIVFTSLFALGVLLLSLFAQRAHLDAQHVLFGQLEFVSSGPRVPGAARLPWAVVQMAGIVALLLAALVAFYKQLLVVAFDPLLAQSLGVNPRAVRYAMLAMLSLTVVGAFSSVGAVLVVGMLITPAATAALLTSRLHHMLLAATLVAAASAVAGIHLAYWLDVSAAGMMVCAATGLFMLAFVASPKSGLLPRALKKARQRLRIEEENLIRGLLRPMAPAAATPAAAATRGGDTRWPTRWRQNRALARLRWRGLIERAAQGGGYRLTPMGLAEAHRLDRAHRLWETYLVEQMGLPSDHVHETAEQLEHLLNQQLVEHVDDALGHPVTDPHGAPIPRSSVADGDAGLFALAKLRAGDVARVAALAIGRAERAQDAGLPLGLRAGERVTIAGHDRRLQTWHIRREDGRDLEVPHDLADRLLLRLEQPT